MLRRRQSCCVTNLNAANCCEIEATRSALTTFCQLLFVMELRIPLLWIASEKPPRCLSVITLNPAVNDSRPTGLDNYSRLKTLRITARSFVFRKCHRFARNVGTRRAPERIPQWLLKKKSQVSPPSGPAIARNADWFSFTRIASPKPASRWFTATSVARI